VSWQELAESWLSTVVPPQSGTGPGAPSQFLSTAVWPILMSEVRKANPNLSQRAAADRIAVWVLEEWVPRHDARALTRTPHP
jgi:hypothetical protein